MKSVIKYIMLPCLILFGSCKGWDKNSENTWYDNVTIIYLNNPNSLTIGYYDVYRKLHFKSIYAPEIIYNIEDSSRNYVELLHYRDPHRTDTLIVHLSSEKMIAPGEEDLGKFGTQKLHAITK